MLYVQSPLLFGGIIFLIAVTSWYLWDGVSKSALMTWVGVNLALTTARVGIVVAFARRQKGSHEAVHWARWSTLMSGISGTVWGSLALWALNPDSIANVIFIVTVLSSMTAASLIALAAWLPAYNSYTFSSLSLLIFGLLAANDTAFRLLAVLIIALLIVHSLFAINVNRSIRETLRLRFENLELLQSLKRQNEIAVKASLDKSVFLAAASHDLRQPLHALDLFLTSMQGSKTLAEQFELVEKARLSSRTLGELLNALLDASRLDAGAVSPKESGFSISPILKTLSSEFEGRARKSGLQLRVRPCDTNVHSDPVLLGRMIRNLVANALQYTIAGGVLVACRRRGPLLRVEVWDTGIGIGEGDQECIFDEFFQLGNQERDRNKGLGMGLAIVRRLSILLRHPVTVHSIPGKGSCFRVEVPVVSMPTPESLSLPGDDDAPGTDIAGTFVILIDDDRQVREGMRILLRKWDCEVLLAVDAESLLEELMSAEYSAPDIIISDFRLPGDCDGIDTVIEVRRKFGRDIPAIIVTGDTGAGTIKKVDQAGCSVLFKPVTGKALRTAIALNCNR